MGERIQIDDESLTLAGASLVQASSMMISDNVGRPAGDLQSLTGIGAIVTEYLKGLDLARKALADAARTGSESIASVMRDSDELEQYIVDSLGTGFAVPGAKGRK